MKFLKKIVPKHILWRMVVILVIPIILLQAIIGVVFYRQYIDNDIEDSVKRIESNVDFIKSYIEKNPNDKDSFLGSMSSHYRGYYKTIPYKKKHRLSCNLSGVMNLVKIELKSHFRKFRICHVKNSNLYRLYIPLNESETLRITHHERYFLSSQWHFLPVWSFASSIILLLIAFIFLKKQLRPLSKLGKAAEAFGKGVWDYKLIPAGAIELRQAGEAFLKMKEKIRSHVEGRTILLAGVSHDLRTILTRFSLEISLMPPSEEINALKDDIKLMEDIIQSYLQFVSHNHEASYEVIHPKKVIEELIKRLSNEKCKIDFHYQGESTILLRNNTLERCVLNLISNAINHGTHILIEAKSDKNGFYFSIEDDGKGVLEKDLENIFKPFFTTKNANHGSVSSGLGLTLTKDIILSYGGKIYAETSKKLGGLKVIFEIPL